MVDQSALRRKVAIAGVGATSSGTSDKDSYRLAVEALRLALDDSAISRSEIDGVLGWTLVSEGGGFKQGVTPHEFCQMTGMNPRVAGSLAYGTGGFTTQYAAFLVASGVCDVVLCVFAMNPGSSVGRPVGASVFDGIYGYANAGAYAGLGWTEFATRVGASDDVLGHIAVTQRSNAVLNPDAAWREPLSMADYLNEPYLIWPLRSLDLARRTAGAVAIIITSAERARDCPKAPVYFEAVGRQQAPRNLETPGYFTCLPMTQVANQVYEASGVGPQDIGVLGVSDASSVAVAQTLVNYGFCSEEGLEEFVGSGALSVGGTTPTNTDGGQLSCGYLVGWLHQVELVRQLRSEAHGPQVASPRLAQYCTTGGAREHFLSTIYSID